VLFFFVFIFVSDFLFSSVVWALVFFLLIRSGVGSFRFGIIFVFLVFVLPCSLFFVAMCLWLVFVFPALAFS